MVISKIFKINWPKYIKFLLKRKLYYAVRNTWPVWFYILNSEGRELYRKNTPKLDNVQEKILGDWDKNGIAVTSIDELFLDPNILSILQDYAKELYQAAEVKDNKKFLKFLFDRHPVIDLKNPYFKLAFDEKIFGIVAHYLGIYPKFRGLTLNITTPMESGAAPIDSQQWHRDPEDKVVCKVFLYLTDVDATSGPFIYASRTHHKGRNGKLFPTAPPAGSYPPEKAVLEKISTDEIKINTGKAGTIIFCETSGLHKGGFATKNERLMFTSIYMTKAATSPIFYKMPPDLDSSQLGPLAKYSLENRSIKSAS